jgi:hypothetical protein
MCLFQLFVASSRLEIFFLLSLQELPAVALPTQEKIDFKTKSTLSGAKNKRFED